MTEGLSKDLVFVVVYRVSQRSRLTRQGIDRAGDTALRRMTLE